MANLSSLALGLVTLGIVIAVGFIILSFFSNWAASNNYTSAVNGIGQVTGALNTLAAMIGLFVIGAIGFTLIQMVSGGNTGF